MSVKGFSYVEFMSFCRDIFAGFRETAFFFTSTNHIERHFCKA